VAWLDTLGGWISRIIAAVMAASGIALTVTMTAQVVMRYALHSSLLGFEEVTTPFGPWLYFMGFHLRCQHAFQRVARGDAGECCTSGPLAQLHDPLGRILALPLRPPDLVDERQGEEARAAAAYSPAHFSLLVEVLLQRLARKAGAVS
jgi:hypothetical protein